MAVDPFTLVFDSLWDLVDASKPLQALVRPGNFIRYNKSDDRGPSKPSVQAGDLPELALIAIGATDENIMQSSCNSTVTRRYAFLLSTGDFRISKFLLPVQFALYCALTDWDAVLRPLLWNNKLFVTSANWEGMNEGISNPDANRNIQGWSSIWSCKIVMHFATSDLKTYNNT